MTSKKEIEERFLKDELSDYKLYKVIEVGEKDRTLKRLVAKLSETELRHAKIWGSLLGERHIENVEIPFKSKLRLITYPIVRKILGIAFVTKLLERNEANGLAEYKELLKGRELGSAELEKIKSIIGDEESHEKLMLEQTQRHEARLNYTKSIVFGMNDGLVEILAVIAGLAMVSTSSIIVAISGIIVGVSGTLSMAAGAYISSKSEKVVEKSLNEEYITQTKPSKEAYYTGIFYFLGAIVATYPFIFGAVGYVGVLESVISVAIVLSIASTLIAVISDTSIKRRIIEMLTVSLGAAAVTTIIGLIVRIVFGIAIS
ncbi:MAG: VIT1/CCC1 family protein [Methanothrix sp.]